VSSISPLRSVLHSLLVWLANYLLYGDFASIAASAPISVCPADLCKILVFFVQHQHLCPLTWRNLLPMRNRAWRMVREVACEELKGAEQTWRKRGTRWRWSPGCSGSSTGCSGSNTRSLSRAAPYHPVNILWWAPVHPRSPLRALSYPVN
jgi:hypothetical protein